MELTKTSLINLTLVETVLGDNFGKIENQFNLLRAQIEQLNQDNKKLTQIVSYSIENSKQLGFSPIFRESETFHIHSQQGQLKENIENIRMIERHATKKSDSHALTPIQRNRTQKSSAHMSNHHKSTKSITNLHSKNQLNDQLLYELELRVSEIEKVQVAYQISKNSKPNKLFSSCKKKKEIPKEIQGQNQKYQGKDGVQNIKEHSNQPQSLMKENERRFSSNESEEEQNEFNNYSQIEDGQDLGIYLQQKIKLLAKQLQESNNKVTQIQKVSKILSKEHQILKRDVENVQLTTRELERQTKDKNAPPNKKLLSEQESRVLNDTMESNRVYYEEKLIELFEDMEKIKKQYIQIAEKLNDEEHYDKDIERQKNIAFKLQEINRCPDEQMRKQVSNCRKQFKKVKEDFERLMNGVNTGTHETRTLVIKPNQSKEDWKNLSTKIFKTRAQLLTNIKELQAKIVANNDIFTNITELEVSIGECKLILQRKCQTADFEKTIKRVQNRLNNFIRQVFEKEGLANEQDAMIVKQPWFCLSCDNQLKNYTGKLMKPQQNQKMQGKKVNPQSHMVRRGNQSKFPTLPSFHS